jgi:hypothetical protein
MYHVERKIKVSPSVTVNWLLKISITNLHTVVFDMLQNKTHFCKCAEVLEAIVQETGFDQVHNKKLQKMHH